MILKKCAFGSKPLQLPVCLRAYLLEVDSGILVAVGFFFFFFKQILTSYWNIVTRICVCEFACDAIY